MRTIVHISDLHFGRHDPVIVEALLANIAQAAPDLVVVSGDLTQRARPGEFIAARAFLDRIAPLPTVVVPGNHDVPLYDVTARFLQPLKRFRQFIGCETRSFFADDELAVLGLNTARSLTIKNGRISFEQMHDIRRAFETVPATALKALVIHHPLAPPSHDLGPAPVGRWRPALAAVAQAGVHLVLSGHYHRVYSDTLAMPMSLSNAAGGSVLTVHAGTAISTRTRERESNTYNIIRTEDGRGLSIAVMAWAGTDFAEGPRAHFELDGRHWCRTKVEA